jgi:hypothetical protein
LLVVMVEGLACSTAVEEPPNRTPGRSKALNCYASGGAPRLIAFCNLKIQACTSCLCGCFKRHMMC